MKQLVKEKIDNVLKKLGIKISSYSIDTPPDPEMGDFASNVAMVAAGLDKKNPREVADEIISELKNDPEIEKTEIAGPGFINITLKSEIYLEELKKIVELGGKYGQSEIGKGKKVNVEFVSANPTGPLHIGNARSGPIGETIANLFEFQGFEVEREFYVNDLGSQITKFGNSLAYWYLFKTNPNLEFPAEGYPGEYIKETSEKIQSEHQLEIEKLENKPHLASPSKGEGSLPDLFASEGLKIMVENIKSDLKLAGINLHTFSYESAILNSGKSEAAIEKLKRLGFTTEKDGALWFKNPADPKLEDKDSVLVKSDESRSNTYFANDIAYHLDKIARGADKLIDVWGANHFGHIPRMTSALQALDCPADILKIILYQYVRLSKAGETSSMGKRFGNFVTLREIIEAGVTPDAFKYFILSQNSDTPITFDLKLATDTTEKNPVFYIKYAHARICSILRKAGDPTSPFGLRGASEEQVELSLLKHKKEIALCKELVKFPELVAETVFDFQIQRLPHFAYKVATLFHDFYGSCKVIGAESKELELARLSLIIATKNILKNTLSLCAIDAPEKM